MASDQSYLLDVCTLSPLLRAEEEILLSKRILAGIALTDPISETYVEEKRRTKDQRRVVLSGLRAEKKMVAANIRLVTKIANMYANTQVLHHLNFDDLVQEGVIGLARAAQKYDYSRGYKFSTYAYWWIRQAITRSIHVHDRMIRLPMGCTEVFTKLRKYVTAYQAEHSGRMPTREEQAKHCDIKVEVLDYYMAHYLDTRSLDETARKGMDSEGSALLDLVADSHPTSNGSSQLETAVDYSVLSKTMQQLSEQERTVLEHRYELGGAPHMTLLQLGEKVGVCRERVRQIEIRAVRKLRTYMAHQPVNFRTISIPKEILTEQLELEVAA